MTHRDTADTIDDALEATRQDPSIDLVPAQATEGMPDSIPRSEQSQDTSEHDSPEQAFSALALPVNDDEVISRAGPLEMLNKDTPPQEL